MSALFPYQEALLNQLVSVHARSLVSLDASDTGVGKTYVAAALAKQLQLAPLVLCPKSVISAWRRVLASFGLSPLDVLNLEALKTGKTPWLQKLDKRRFLWRIPEPERALLVFDEAHRCGAPDSQNAILLAATKAQKLRVHLMSATLADSPLRLRAVGYLTNLHNWYDFWPWALQNGCRRNMWNGVEFCVASAAAQRALARIHAHLFPAYGVRARVADLPGFPENFVQVVRVDCEDPAHVDEAYEEVLSRSWVRRAESEGAQHALVSLLRARQASELAKLPAVAEIAQSLVEEGKSVVVFANFRETLDALQSLLAASFRVACIHGDQTQEERDEAVRLFQENRAPVCLAIVQAGGIGLSLHDLHGRPRVSLIFPPLSARDFRQALGRIHRAGAKTPAVQQVLLAANTVEERIARRLEAKLKALDMLNDGDLAFGDAEEPFVCVKTT